jgi:hypothetical protein
MFPLLLNLQREHLQRGGIDGMVAVTLQESGTGARAKVRVHHENHPTEARKGNMHWTGTGKDIGIEIELMILKVREGSGIGNVRRVEAKRGMTLTGVEAEKEKERETGIGEDERSKLFSGLFFWEFRWNVLRWRDAHVVGPGLAAMKKFLFSPLWKKKFLSISCINPQEETCFMLNVSDV